MSDGDNQHAIPSHFATNDLTGIFQEIIDTYGVPAYREVRPLRHFPGTFIGLEFHAGQANPAVLTVITFPFMFGTFAGCRAGTFPMPTQPMRISLQGKCSETSAMDYC